MGLNRSPLVNVILYWVSALGGWERFRGTFVTRLMEKYRFSNVFREAYWFFNDFEFLSHV